MKAVIVSSFDTYLERIELLKEYYESRGYETTVILSNFRHFKKEFINESRERFEYIDTKPYYKNLSMARISSHYKFARDAFEKVDELKPELLHVLIPANSLAKEADKYKKKHPEIKLYFDLIDLWPETMPIGNIKTKFPFSLWKDVRDRHLDRAEVIFTECDLYRNVLKKENDDRYKTLYWAYNGTPLLSSPNININEINLCYLGSINNIIDIDMIVDICSKLKKYKAIKLHVIGNGEKKSELLEKLEQKEITFIDYGVIYDNVEKQKIFDGCWFGLNVMKKTVCVGLTMKSIDYLKASLPILNTIPYDTEQMVNTFDVGLSIRQGVECEILELTEKDLLLKRENARSLFASVFSKNAFFSTMDSILKLSK